MELRLSTEQEAELARISRESGRSADELALEAVERYLGREAGRNEAVPAAVIWETLEHALRV